MCQISLIIQVKVSVLDFWSDIICNIILTKTKMHVSRWEIIWDIMISSQIISPITFDIDFLKQKALRRNLFCFIRDNDHSPVAKRNVQGRLWVGFKFYNILGGFLNMWTFFRVNWNFRNSHPEVIHMVEKSEKLRKIHWKIPVIEV